MLEYIKIHMGDVIKPKEGYICLLNRWCIVTLENEVLFYAERPVCNHSRAITRAIKNRINRDYVTILIPVVYVPNTR